jgi:uncharacterized protein (DUF697 family)
MKKDPHMTPQTTGSEGNEAAVVEAAEMTDEGRDKLASKLVDRFSLWSGAAGLIPVPLVDVTVVGGIQLQMLRRLSEIYGVPFSENMGKSVIASLAGSVIPASTGMGVVSALKGIPAIGMAISGFIMPAFSAGATYLIGKVFIQHFASGGTLLDFSPPDYREFIKSQKEKFATAPRAEQPLASTKSASGKGATATSS